MFSRVIRLFFHRTKLGYANMENKFFAQEVEFKKTLVYTGIISIIRLWDIFWFLNYSYFTEILVNHQFTILYVIGFHFTISEEDRYVKEHMHYPIILKPQSSVRNCSLLIQDFITFSILFVHS